MKTCLSALCVLLISVPIAGLSGQSKKTPPAKVAITAELVCMHCDFGLGDDCAPALRMGKTPVLLAGKVAKDFEDDRFDQKFLVVEGALTLNKKKHLVLTSDKGVFYTAENKTAPAKGTARVEGAPICGNCDLMLCDECTLAIANGSQ